MEEITAKTVNWFDIKDDVKIIKEETTSKRIKPIKMVMRHKNNVNTLELKFLYYYFHMILNMLENFYNLYQQHSHFEMYY